MAHKLLGSYTVPSDTTSLITVFSNIPQTYTDLKILTTIKVGSTGAWYDSFIYFNGNNSGAGYFIYGSGSGASGSTENVLNMRTTASSSAASGIFGNTTLYIPDYTLSGRNKTMIADQSAEGAQASGIQMWTNMRSDVTDPITNIGFKCVGTDVIVAGSKFWLYGIKNS